MDAAALSIDCYPSILHHTLHGRFLRRTREKYQRFAQSSYFSACLSSLKFEFRPSTCISTGLVSLRRRSLRVPLCGGGLESGQIALLLEVDGVLMDPYRLGNRQAFNVAFQKLGLDCANWTEPVYSDLLRKGAGDEERMLVLYFNRTGWPTALPTSEKESFMKSILREKKNALADIVMSKDLPLRPGVEKFIDDACDEGMPVVILAASSKIGEEIARATVKKLGDERICKIKVVGTQEVETSLYGQLVRGQESFSGAEEELANEASRAVAAEKQRIAKEVASMLKLRVDINTGTPESIKKIVAVLRSGAECAGVPVQNCVLVAGGQPGVAAAEIIGMPCVVLRSSITYRAEFRSAIAVMDGFGGVDLTVSKLRLKLQS